MDEMQAYLKKIGFTPDSAARQNRSGIWYRSEVPEISGRYWYMENDLYIADIHDFFIKEELILSHEFRPDTPIAMISSYIISGNGECLEPYSNLTSGSLFLLTPSASPGRYILHGRSPYKAVGIKFKHKMLKHYFIDRLEPDSDTVLRIFYSSRDTALQPLADLSREILAQDFDAANAEVFMDAKAIEWLSLTVEAYTEAQRQKHKIRPEDDEALELAAAYINDHYACPIRQHTLEQIALMSGTKLKSTFKAKYHMTITEYIQRRRMNAAEVLLFNSEMQIKAIAQAVGYHSPNRFSELYKRYKGCSPSEARKRAR